MGQTTREKGKGDGGKDRGKRNEGQDTLLSPLFPFARGTLTRAEGKWRERSPPCPPFLFPQTFPSSPFPFPSDFLSPFSYLVSPYSSRYM